MSSAIAPRLRDYLEHITQAIARIESYVESMDDSDFGRDTRTQDAVIRNLEIIGEASRNIERRYPEFAAQHPQVPWSIAYEMRNVLAHGYFKVDPAKEFADTNPLLPKQHGPVGQQSPVGGHEPGRSETVFAIAPPSGAAFPSQEIGNPGSGRGLLRRRRHRGPAPDAAR